MPDLRLAFRRALARQPMTSALAVTAPALAIGLTTTTLAIAPDPGGDTRDAARCRLSPLAPASMSAMR